MSTTPVIIDPSSIVPLSGSDARPSQAGALQGAVAYGVTQDPDQHAQALDLQKRTGIGPRLSQGNEKQIQQAVDVNSIDYPRFAAANPRTTAWASNPDNAAVSGVNEIQRLGGIEQNAAQMRAYDPSTWQSVKDSVGSAVGSATNWIKQKAYDLPLTRMAISTVGGTAGMAGDIGSMVGWHGDGPSSENLLQKIDSSLKPENVFAGDPYAGVANYATSNGLDKAAPIIAGLADTVTEVALVGWVARTMSLSENAARLLTAASVALGFSAQQGGHAYTQVAGSGGNDIDARSAANKTAAYNLPANMLMGFADRIPGVRDFPLLSSAGTGALAGASGAATQNVITGKPWYTDIFSQAAQGAAIQAGMHIGMEGFHANLQAASDAVAQSKLAERSPEANADALHGIVGDAPSLRIPAEQFNSYFKGQNADPAAVAAHLGSTNYTEAVMSGGQVEVPTDSFLSKLDIEHRNALIPDVVNPATEMTHRQQDAAGQELADWAKNGGAEKMQAAVEAADAETASTPEYAQVKEQLRQRYTDAGETPEVAETLATKDANAYSNLARSAGMKPSELLNLYNPKVVAGEAPGVNQTEEAKSAAKGRTIGDTNRAESAFPAGQEADSASQSVAQSGIQGNLTSEMEPPGTQEPEPAPAEIPKVATPKEIAANGGRIPFGRTGSMKRADIKLAPDEFQYKLGTDAETGTTDQFADVGKYDPELGGTSHIWYDPKDGQAYMVNGHHRYELAERSGVEDMNVMPIEAETAKEARAKGALFNIADGKGTAFDAAKYFRDSGETPETLAAKNISLKKGVAREGFAMSRLAPEIFDDAVQGRVDKSRAVALGEQTGDHAVQEETLKKVREKEAEGGHVSDAWVKEYARQIVLAGGARSVEDKGSLFGGMTTESLIDQRTDVTSYVREKLAADKNLFGGLTDPKKAARLGEVKGQKINAAKNALIAEQADNARLAFEVESRKPGEVNDAINDAAKRLKDGEPKKQVLAEAYDRIGAALREADSRGSRSHGGDVSAGTGGDAGAEPEVGKPLFQSGEDGVQGWYRRHPDGSIEIGHTKKADLSTDLHEMGHSYLDIMSDLSKRDGASDVLKDDYRKSLDFIGAKDGEARTPEQNEKWALATELYLREAKAPSQDLKGVFQRFGIWLSSIYKKASDLGVELTPEIRGVMDRLYASEQGVNRAETEAGPRLFTSPEQAGWSDEQFKQYAADNNMSAEQAKADILGRLNEAAVRDRSQAWRDEEQNVREAVTADIDQRPEYSAIRALRKGELDDGTKLAVGKEDLVKQFGEERVKELQKAHPGLYRNEGGEDPEVVAELFGYHSAEEMMRAIEATPRRSAAIETATRDFMTAKHGDIRYDGTLDDQARLALENDNRAKGMHAELTALKQKVAGMSAQRDAVRAIDVAPIASYREAARQMVEKKSPADLQPSRYLDASRKYSREAFEALQKGDAQAAANAKHKELMNHFLFREATEAKEYIGKFEAYAKRVQKTAAQSKLGLAGADYRDQFNRILGRYGLGPQLPAGERTLAEWAASQYEQGKEPAIDPAIYNEARNVNYRSAPVAEIRQVHDALVNIRKLASLELGMEVNGKRIEFDAAAGSMEARARESLTAKPVRVLKQNATFSEKATDYAQRGNALLMRTEFLMKMLDGGETGPWHDYLWHLAADSQGSEYKLQAEVTKRIGDAFDNMPKEQRRGMLDKVSVDGIPETVTRHDLVSMAFNMGNDGNFDRLQKTFITHGWDPEAIHRAAGMLTREEWQFVQDGWDSLKPLGQAQSDLERRLTGLPPLMVKPAPFDIELGTAGGRTGDGTMMHLEGGYYPIVMDPRYGARGAQQDAGTTAQNLMEAGYGRAATSRGNMQARTGFGGPLQLDYEQVLTQHTAKVIKDITHREFMLAANKLLLDPRVRQTMRETLGDGYEEKMMPWLRTIINDRNGSATQGLGDVSKTLRALRTNLVRAALTFKVSTVLLQVTHASSMFNYTSPGSYAQAMVDFLAHPKDMSDEIRNLSPNEMASRGENIDRDLRTLIQTETGKQGIGHAIARAGMAPVQFMDHAMSFPLWLSVYRDSLKENVELPEEQARYKAMQKADGAVRMGLGSNAPKDLPPIMRNNDFTKLITTLGGFHNLKFNQMSSQVGDAFNGRSGQSAAARAGKLTYGMLLSAVIPAVLGQLVTGHGPKDGENPGLWAAKKALLFPFETIPVLGNIVEGMEGKGDVSFSPLQGMAERAAKAGARAGADTNHKDWTGIGMDGVQSAMDAFGVVGTDQAAKTIRYARQASNGKIDNPNVWDALAGSPRKQR